MKRRSKVPPIEAGQVPPALAIGPCIEVWSDDSDSWPPQYSTRRRFSQARRLWLSRAGIEQTRNQCDVIPCRAPWSAEYLIAAGRGDYVTQRLAAASVTVEQLPSLREQAEELLTE